MRRLSFLLLGISLLSFFARTSSAEKKRVQKDCRALLSFRAADNRTVGGISRAFGVPIQNILAVTNRSRLSVHEGEDVIVPATCSMFHGAMSGVERTHNGSAVYSYKTPDNETSLDEIAEVIFGGLANATELAELNAVNGTNATEIFLVEGRDVTIVIPCACSFPAISDPDVLFLTYRLSDDDSLMSTALQFSSDPSAIQAVNTLDSPFSFVPGLLILVPMPACVDFLAGALVPAGTSYKTARQCIQCSCDVRFLNRRLHCAQTGRCPDMMCPGSKLKIGEIGPSFNCSGRSCSCEFTGFDEVTGKVHRELRCDLRNCKGNVTLHPSAQHANKSTRPPRPPPPRLRDPYSQHLRAAPPPQAQGAAGVEYPTGTPHSLPLLAATNLGSRRACQSSLVGVLIRASSVLVLPLLST